jgi:hypothetical protein
MLVDFRIILYMTFEAFQDQNVLNILKYLGINVTQGFCTVEPNLLMCVISWDVVFPYVCALQGVTELRHLLRTTQCLSSSTR